VHVGVTVGSQPAPPPPQAESPGAKAGFIWARGHWGWTNGSYQWINGHWERERASKHWEEGRWENNGGTWVYIEGGWR
jgi:hypothetical protein